MIKDIDENLKFTNIEDIGSYYYLHFVGDVNQEVGFSKYNEEHYMEVVTMNDDNFKEYILKVEKKHITDSIVEIEFWEYPSELELKKEFTILD